jgi:cytochrome oxidase assembly protein ShyY1
MVVNILPEKHIAYAVQWFAMGVVLLVLFIVRSVRRE